MKGECTVEFHKTKDQILTSFVWFSLLEKVLWYSRYIVIVKLILGPVIAIPKNKNKNKNKKQKTKQNKKKKTEQKKTKK